MLLLLKLLVSLASLIGVGRFVCRLARLDTGRPLYERAALWFVLGSAGASLMVFWLSLVDSATALKAAAIFGLFAMLSFAASGLQFTLRCVAARRASGPAPASQEVSRTGSLLNLALSSALLVQIVCIAFAVAFTAVGWDGIMNWGIKAKVFFVHGGVPLSYFSDTSMVGSHLNYPLLVPVSEAWVYFFVGGVNERLVKFFFLGMFLSLLAIFYRAIRREHPPRYAISFTLLLGVTPEFLKLTASGYAELPLSVFMLGAAAYLYFWLKEGRSSDLMLAATLSALGMWVKREGMIFWLINLFAIIMWAIVMRGRPGRLRARAVLTYLVPALFMVPWYLLLAWQAVPDVDFGPIGLSAAIAHLDRLPVLAQMLIAQMASIDSWGVLWALFILAALYGSRKALSAGEAYLFGAVVGYIGVMTFLYTFSAWGGGYALHVQSSLDRIVFQVVPIAVFFIAVRSRPSVIWARQRLMRARGRARVHGQGSSVQYS